MKKAPAPHVGAANALARDLIDHEQAEKRLLAYLIATYAYFHPEGTIPCVIVVPDGDGNIGAAGLVDEPEKAVELMLHGICGVAIQACGLDLPDVQKLLAAAWGEREQQGMGRVGAHRSASTARRPATRRGRGKRGRKS